MRKPGTEGWLVWNNPPAEDDYPLASSDEILNEVRSRFSDALMTGPEWERFAEELRTLLAEPQEGTE